MNESQSAAWSAYANGETIGTTGAEGGQLVRDEEHISGARITLEQDCISAPYAITCSIYEWLLHTRFFADEPTAAQQYDRMKSALEGLIALIPTADAPDADPDQAQAAIDSFVEAYP